MEPGTLTIQLMDMYGGSLVHQAEYDDGQHMYTFTETSQLQTGFLYYQVEINGNVAAGSVIKH